MRKLAAAAIPLLVLAAAPPPAAAQAMEPGEWQITTTMTSSMLPKPQSVTHTQCIKKEEANDPNRLMGGQQSSGCKVTTTKKSADGYSWEISCPKEGMRGSGSVRTSRDKLEGEMRMHGDAGGQKMEMLSKLQGRRMGPCKS